MSQDIIHTDELSANLEADPVTRRGFLKGAAAVGVAVGSGGLLTAGEASAARRTRVARSASTEVIYSTWGGSWGDDITEAWFKPFTKETGIKVVTAGPPNYGQIEAMVTSNATEWDIAEVDPDFQFIGQKKHLLTPINWHVVNKAYFDKGNSQLYTRYSVPQSLWSAVITWRKDKFKNAPRTWADVWDTQRFPGTRAFDASTLDDGSFEAALIADGVSPKHLYPLDIDRALKKFDQIKSDLIWFKSGAQGVQVYQTGQAVIGLGWDGRLDVLQHTTHSPIAYTRNQAFTQWADMVVPKGAPHADAAMKLLEFATRAKQQAKMAHLSWYGPITPAAFPYIPKYQRTELSGTTHDIRIGIPINWKWWANNYDAVNAKFTAWLTA